MKKAILILTALASMTIALNFVRAIDDDPVNHHYAAAFAHLMGCEQTVKDDLAGDIYTVGVDQDKLEQDAKALTKAFKRFAAEN